MSTAMEDTLDPAEHFMDNGGATQALIPEQRTITRPRLISKHMLFGILVATAFILGAVGAYLRPTPMKNVGTSFRGHTVQQQMLVGNCAGPTENCHGSQCCQVAGMQCYEKNSWWGKCMDTCHAGPNPTDTNGEHWSCKALGERKSGIAKCGGYGEDCSSSHCCAEVGMQCFQKNDTAATCRYKCTPGVDFSDVDSNPWSCKKLGNITPGRAAWVTSPSSKCAKTSYEDCTTTKCCATVGAQCLTQNPYYATCHKKCPDGWDCDKLGMRTPMSLHEAAHAAVEPSGLGPWVAAECAKAGENCTHEKCCADPNLQCFTKGGNWSTCKAKCTGFPEPTHKNAAGWECKELGHRTPGPYLPSLFCFAVFMPKSYERTLIRAQLNRGVGIFACDGYALLSAGNATWTLGIAPWGKVEVQPFEPAQVGTSRDGTAGNAQIFMNAWDRVKKDGSWIWYDFIVKVDPDALIVPQRLRLALANYNGHNVYMINCHKPNGMKPMMFGSVEALSQKALKGYFKNKDICVEELKWQTWGEDLFMGKCLQKLGTKAAQNLKMVSDGVCLGINCSDASAAAFHPLKNLTSWNQCLHAISTA